MNIKWYLNRARTMSWEEMVFYRTPQFLYKNIIFRFFPPIRNPNLRLRSEFKVPLYNLNELQLLFEKSNWKDEYDFFQTRIELNKAVHWRKDYANNIASNPQYYADIKRQCICKVGDIKYVSELNRMHFMPFMAFHFINSKDEQVLNRITTLIRSWEVQNPFLKSINYTSGIEVGIRSLNLVYTHLILNSFNVLTKELDLLLKTILENHYQFLKNNLSLHSSANNHLVGELMGLVVISSYFECGNLDHLKWERKFLGLIKNKFNPDGIDNELSTRYHLAVTDHFLNGLWFLKQRGCDIDHTIFSNFRKSFDFIEHVSYNDQQSYLGDNDDSYLIYPFFDRNFSLSDSLLDSRHFLFENSATNPLDFRNYLIFGSAYFNSKPKEVLLPQSTFFKASGYAFSYNHDKKIKVAFDCGSIGDNKLMAHGHSDQLSFIVQMEDFMYIVDPGTYQYHSSKSSWRNYFRGITAHNTITVNSKNHGTALNRMGWINTSKIIKAEFESNSGCDILSSQIDGFKTEGVLHTRSLTHNKTQNSILIEDFLEIIEGKTRKNIAFFLHFHPDAEILKSKNTIVILSPSKKKIQVSNPLFGKSKLIKGNKELPFGWFSGAFDKLQESTALLLEFTINSDTTIKTLINY